MLCSLVWLNVITMNKYLQTDWRERMICKISLSSLFLLRLFLYWHRKSVENIWLLSRAQHNECKNTDFEINYTEVWIYVTLLFIETPILLYWFYNYTCNIMAFLFSVNPDVRLRYKYSDILYHCAVRANQSTSIVYFHVFRTQFLFFLISSYVLRLMFLLSYGSASSCYTLSVYTLHFL